MRHPTNTARTVPFGWVKGYPLNKNYNAPNKPGEDYGFHMGTDYAYSNADPYLYAPEDGEVTFMPNNGTMGNAVYLKNDNRFWGFGHNSSYLIGLDNGDWVNEGEKLAIMGDTGAADGKHCHAALQISGVLTDCYAYINQSSEDIMEEVSKLYELLDQTNKNVDKLYEIVDATNKNVENLFTLMNETNLRVDSLEQQVGKVVAINTDLTKKLTEVTVTDPNDLVISRKGWDALWSALKSFFNSNK